MKFNALNIKVKENVIYLLITKYFRLLLCIGFITRDIIYVLHIFQYNTKNMQIMLL